MHGDLPSGTVVSGSRQHAGGVVGIRTVGGGDIKNG